VRDELGVQPIRHALLARLVPLGRRVPAVVAYDNFQVQPEAMDAYVQMPTEVAPHIFEHEQEAHEHLRRIEDAAAMGISPRST